MNNRTLGLVVILGALGALAVFLVRRAQAQAPTAGGGNIGTGTFEPLVNVGPACPPDQVMISGGICIPIRREDTGLPEFGAPGTTPSNPGGLFFFGTNTQLVV